MVYYGRDHTTSIRVKVLNPEIKLYHENLREMSFDRNINKLLFHPR